jgi:hypothetical protein
MDLVFPEEAHVGSRLSQPSSQPSVDCDGGDSFYSGHADRDSVRFGTSIQLHAL